MTATAKNDPEQARPAAPATADSSGSPPGAAEDAGADGSGPFTLQTVRALAQVMKDFELGELELSRPSGDRLRLKSRRADIATVQPAQKATAPIAPVEGLGSGGGVAAAGGGAKEARPAKEPGVTVIAAPLVGTFYRSPSPDSPSFVEVGQRVKKGQPLCIIEAMKLMNELESDVDGVVTAILGENGRPVEYGEPLFYIKAG
ncbi:MAG: acetyl-CoA carboxylase biotin carboxyl carrier protein [Polyangia bacterium]